VPRPDCKTTAIAAGTLVRRHWSPNASANGWICDEAAVWCCREHLPSPVEAFRAPQSDFAPEG